MDDWRSPTQRNIVIQKLESLLKETGSTQSSVELEKALFEKSKSKDEYNNCFKNMALQISRKKPSMQQGQMPSGVNPMMAARAPQQQMMGGQQNHMNYNQNYQYGGGGGPPGMSGGGGGMGMPSGHRPQQPPQYPMYPGPNPGHMQQNYPNMGMQPSYNRPPNYGSPHGGMAMGNYGQPGSYSQPNMMGGQRMHGPGGIMRPNMMGPGMQPSMMRPSMPSGQFLPDNGGQQVHAVPNPSYSSSAVRPMNPSPAYTSGSSSITNSQVPSSHPGGSVPPFSMASSSAPGSVQSIQNVPPSSTTHTPATTTSMSGSSGPVAETAGQPHQQQPHQPNLGESAAVTNPPTPSMFQSVNSPAPPTPVYPVSPATGMQGVPSNQPAMTPEENEAYMRKLSELQKYIPVMSEWINRLSKDDRKTDQYTKLKSLYNLLQNPSKRVALPTLMKCETALEKMFDKNHDKANPNSVPPSSVPPLSVPSAGATAGSSATPAAAPQAGDPPVPPEPKLPIPQQSQSLLDFKMTRSPPPTYSNLRSCIPQTSDPFDRLPAAKRRRLLSDTPSDDKENKFQLPAHVKRELMHLQQFDVKVMSEKSQESKEIILECSLNNKCDLPEVPSLTIVLPREYPTVSPQCDLTHYFQVTSPFVRKVGELLSDAVSKRVGCYTFSALLDSWFSSILSTIAEMLEEA